MKGAGEEVDRVKGEEIGVASTMFRDGVPDSFIYYNFIVYNLQNFYLMQTHTVKYHVSKKPCSIS